MKLDNQILSTDQGVINLVTRINNDDNISVMNINGFNVAGSIKDDLLTVYTTEELEYKSESKRVYGSNVYLFKIKAIIYDRPYEKELRLNKSYVNFGVISQYFMDRVMEDFLNKEHKKALILNREMN